MCWQTAAVRSGGVPAAGGGGAGRGWGRWVAPADPQSTGASYWGVAHWILLEIQTLVYTTRSQSSHQYIQWHTSDY